MNFSCVLLFAFACFTIFAMTSAAPGNFFEDLEEAGQRIRDAIISAQPAVDTIAQAAAIIRGEQPQQE